MNYRERVERESLGEEGKNRVIAAVAHELEQNRTRAPLPWKRVLAVGVSLALLCAVTVPTVSYLTRTPENGGNTLGTDVPDSGIGEDDPHEGETGTPSEGDNEHQSGGTVEPGDDHGGGTGTPSEGDNEHQSGGTVEPGDDHGGGTGTPGEGDSEHQSGSTGDSGGTGVPGGTDNPGWGAPIDPNGADGAFTGDYQVFYGADETIKVTCKVLTAHKVSEPVIEEKGFSVISVRLISAQPNSLGYMQAPSVPWTEYTYEVELKAAEVRTSYSVRLTFTTDNGISVICGFWGYRPQEGKHADEIFCSHISGDAAFRAYLNYIRDAGEISEWQYEELLSDYQHSGGVIEDTWIEFPQ